MEDTNILDTDIMIGQNGSNICDGTGSVSNINAEGIRGFDRTAGSIDEGIPVFSGTAEKIIDPFTVCSGNLRADRRKGFHIMVKQSKDIIPVRQADLLPHIRRRGSDPRDVLKAPGSDHLHQSLTAVLFLYQIDKGSSDHMRQMADGSSDVIMLFAGDHKRDGLQGGDKLPVFFNPFLPYGSGRGEDIVGILQKKCLGVGKACPFTASHGVASDKLILQRELFNMPVDIGFDTADIGKQTIL